MQVWSWRCSAPQPYRLLMRKDHVRLCATDHARLVVKELRVRGGAAGEFERCAAPRTWHAVNNATTGLLVQGKTAG